MRMITVKEGQNIKDIALQYYGSVTATFALIKDNPQVAVNNFVISAGEQLLINPENIVNEEIVNYYESINYEVNTGGETIPFADFNDDFGNDYDT